jgi:hypothetical protein
VTDKQPEALRLAEHLEDQGYYLDSDAAAELRRLHEVNAALVEALEEICDCPRWPDPATIPKAGIEAAPNQVVLNMSVGLRRIRKAEAAIAKATGEQQ